jgi:hypothetical protein
MRWRDPGPGDQVRDEGAPRGGAWLDRRALWPSTFYDEFCGEFVTRRDRRVT